LGSGARRRNVCLGESPDPRLSAFRHRATWAFTDASP
jgi:hypothetical protein